MTSTTALKFSCCECCKELAENELLQFHGPESFACIDCVTNYYRTTYGKISQEQLDAEIEPRRRLAAGDVRRMRSKLERQAAQARRV